MANPTTERGDRRTVRTWLLGALIFLVLRLAGDYVPITTAEGWLWITRIAELWLVMGLLAIALVRVPSTKGRLIHTDRVRTGVVGAVVVAMFIGHLVFLDGLYPFVSWPMYTSSISSLEFGELEIEAADGDWRPLPLHDLPSLSREPRAVKDTLWRLGIHASEGDGDAEDTLRKAVSTILSAASIEARSLTVRTCTVTEPSRPEPADCETVISLDLSDPK